MAIEEGDRLPDHALTGIDGAPLPLRGFLGKPLVLYFYPKDDTTGCTREAIDFSALAPEFAAAEIAVLGVSKDSPASHAKFAKKHDLTIALATDADGVLIEDFGAWVEKSMYGRRFMGVERSTYLFRANGKLARAWRKVKVAGHAAEVLAAARDL
ncbi:peroxiredoxin [Sphingomonas sp.]|uniref:peroxiredoxin n=1 Tax=Sphingomonas sp. TaxID=28214 RepID=UPI002D04C32C|nr:peroxiredoxin [Sphingomonas sp.]HWK35124.1 peroxiredoxin [Sphingomonas sp.]